MFLRLATWSIRGANARIPKLTVSSCIGAVSLFKVGINVSIEHRPTIGNMIFKKNNNKYLILESDMK